jgi:hypothetical protein
MSTTMKMDPRSCAKYQLTMINKSTNLKWLWRQKIGDFEPDNTGVLPSEPGSNSRGLTFLNNVPRRKPLFLSIHSGMPLNSRTSNARLSHSLENYLNPHTRHPILLLFFPSTTSTVNNSFNPNFHNTLNLIQGTPSLNDSTLSSTPSLFFPPTLTDHPVNQLALAPKAYLLVNLDFSIEQQNKHQLSTK